MRPVSILALASLVVVFVSGCSTIAIYQPQSQKTEGIGYQDIVVNDSTYRVKFWGSQSNTEESVNDAAMYRVAEYTAEKGYEYFIMLDDLKSFVKRDQIDSWYDPITGKSTTIPPMADPDKATWQVQHWQVTGPVRTKTFAMGKGEAPSGASIAKDVMTEYATKITRPTN